LADGLEAVRARVRRGEARVRLEDQVDLPREPEALVGVRVADEVVLVLREEVAERDREARLLGDRGRVRRCDRFLGACARAPRDEERDRGGGDPPGSHAADSTTDALAA